MGHHVAWLNLPVERRHHGLEVRALDLQQADA